MITERKRESARANGAKSRGPVTPEGKAQSSKNAVKHGLTSAVTIILPGESEDQFRREHADLVRSLHPVSDAEAKLVEDIANIQWQMSRVARINSHLLALQIDAMRESIDLETVNLSPEARIALAFQSLAHTSNALPALDRHLSHLRRQHKYLCDALARLQSLETESPQNQNLQNEPTGVQLPSNEQPTPPEAGASTAGPGAPLSPGAGYPPFPRHPRSSLRQAFEPTTERPLPPENTVGEPPTGSPPHSNPLH